ncbi:MAG: hypothetical protein HS115_06950 [Spirochaetales bacterium]|nr:hypothetical protein [Spirochaetales bacterium]
MTVPEAIAHEKLLKHFGSAPFSAADAERSGVTADELASLTAQGLLQIAGGQYTIVEAEDFLALEAELAAERRKLWMLDLDFLRDSSRVRELVC